MVMNRKKPELAKEEKMTMMKMKIQTTKGEMIIQAIKIK
jgi:hypothetical protein